MRDDAVYRWMRHIGSMPRPDYSKVNSMVEEYQKNPNDTLHEDILNSMMNLITERAFKFCSNYNFQDLFMDFISIGTLTVMKALKTWRADGPASFCTYCRIAIDRTVMDELLKIKYNSVYIPYSKRRDFMISNTIKNISLDDIKNQDGVESSKYPLLRNGLVTDALMSLQCKNYNNTLQKLIDNDAFDWLVSTLNEEEKILIVGIYLEGRSLQDIADKLKISKKGLERRICVAAGKIKKLLVMNKMMDNNHRYLYDCYFKYDRKRYRREKTDENKRSKKSKE